MREIVISKNEAGQRLNKLVMKYLNKAPSSFVYRMIRKKNIKLNNGKAVGNEIVYVGDVIQLYLSDETIESFRDDSVRAGAFTGGNRFKPEIIYHDHNILIVNKPAGVLSQKASKDDYSINESVIDYLLDNEYITETQLRTFKPSVCNRLDRNTSGLVLCGVSLMGSQELSRIIRERRIDKYYYTIVKGNMTETQDITAYLVKDDKKNTVTIRDSVEEIRRAAGDLGYDKIHTIFQPVRTNGKYTELKVKLITGKTHQIRAQLQHMGYPVIGDQKYGDRETNIHFRQTYKLRNQILHCGEVEFTDVVGGLDYLTGKSFSAFKPDMYKRIEKDLFEYMATWNSRGLRGSTLEDMINNTNEYYRQKNLALVQKIPTPITPIKIDKDSSQITLAYFEKDSTVDYIGVVQGVPVCFDAKECATDTFTMRNIHEHQIRFMEDFERQNGVSFLIIMFSGRNELYYMRFEELKGYLERVQNGHANNFKYNELDPNFFIRAKGGALVHYLEPLSRDLDDRG